MKERQVINRLVQEVRNQFEYQRIYERMPENVANGELLIAANCYADLARQQVLTRDTKALKKWRGNRYLRGVYPGGMQDGYKLSGPIMQEPSDFPFTNKWMPGTPQQNIMRSIALMLQELERLENHDAEVIGLKKPKKKKESEEGVEIDVADTGAIISAPINWTSLTSTSVSGGAGGP